MIQPTGGPPAEDVALAVSIALNNPSILKMKIAELEAQLTALETRRQEDVRVYRCALLWTLWHHQGGSSPVGQPIRKLLGIGEYDHLTPEQLAEAKAFPDFFVFKGEQG